MKIRPFILAFASALLFSCSGGERHVSYVDPFIGTDFNGHTSPGACVPHGLVQAGPQTGIHTWDYCSGYRYTDTLLLGFSQTRLSGTGCADLGDILVMPFSDSVRTDYASHFDKSSEFAEPGYYTAYMDENRVRTEITAAPHTALYRFTFDGPRRNVYMDLNSVTGGRKVTFAEVSCPDASTLAGTVKVHGWVRRQYSFVMQFDSPIVSQREWREEDKEASYRVFSFEDNGKPLMMKIALSSVSAEGAGNNLAAEIPDWDFEKARSAAVASWQEVLSMADVMGSDREKTIFYTALYHMYIQPNNIADVDGQYRGADDKIHQAASGKHYSTLSQWDTFRAANPFYSMMTPQFGGELAVSMIEQAREQGFLPIWALWGQENYCMIGNHSVPVVVEAALRGLPGVDADEAYSVVKQSLTQPHRKSDWELYDRYGYLPFDLAGSESIARTLEMGYDDYCAALLAEKLGYTEDALFFRKRSQYYRNVYDPSTRLARGRDSEGNWRTPFLPFSYQTSSKGGDYTEGNCWQYTWHVLQDVPGLIEIMGGKDAFVTKLDSLFVFTPDESVTGYVPDVSGLIGQYAHGNEPSHHVAYLYALAGRPDRTAEVIREVCDRYYTDQPDGLCGNEDCGQMSAWYVFSALGFYPVDPASDTFVFGAPQIPGADLRMPGGKLLKVRAKGLSETAKYVGKITLNGVQVSAPSITLSELLEGGELVFEMIER